MLAARSAPSNSTMDRSSSILSPDATIDKQNKVPRNRFEPLLIVDTLTVTYSAQDQAAAAVREVSFEIKAGERVALVGESGSGKTTLALTLAGFSSGDANIRADRLSFAGSNLTGRSRYRLPQRIPGLTMVFQDAMTSLDPLWTIGSQLSAVVRQNEKIRRDQLRVRMEYWLRRVGLVDFDRIIKARPYELSGGMRQRVMLALALSSQPRLLIADEPTSALDASLAREMMELMTELTEAAGTSLLIVTHDLHLCQSYVDTIMVMFRGRIVEKLPATDIVRNAEHPYTRGLLSCVPTLECFDMDLLPVMRMPKQATAT